MDTDNFTLPRGKKGLKEFADHLIEFGNQVGFKISSRGWCYQLEGFRLINKNEFDKVETAINNARKSGYLPIDFVADEEGRHFSGIEFPNTESPTEWIWRYVKKIQQCHHWYTPNWWEGETYYIQILVEKIDLKTLFEKVCGEYHIPIATSKGWGSLLQRAEYTKRFKEAEERGMKCVLLYCGDHDPDGLRISEYIRSNLEELKDIRWEDGKSGYDPANLTIERFGLDYEFIEANHLTWIDNLITGSGKNLASPNHANFNQPYVQTYLRTIGERKCEANAIIVNPESGKALCRDAIERYLGNDAIERFEKKEALMSDNILQTRKHLGLDDVIKTIKEKIDVYDEDEENAD